MGSRRGYAISFLFLLVAYALTPTASFKGTVQRSTLHSLRMSPMIMSTETIPTTVDETTFKVVSFNILAPCYNKISGGERGSGTGAVMEAEFKDKYMARNQAICDQLLQSKADIICLQEYWSGSEELRDLYKGILCGPKGAGYTFTEQRRTSHWRIRDDGLACFIKDERIIVQDTRAILFHDCGDRVAQMLLLALRPPPNSPKNTPAQQFICVNTHLLFPHNEYSTKIRLRELAKILGFVESYRMRELCSTICGRSDVRLPVIIAGDFNGSPRGAVHRFARSQNYNSAFEEYCKALEPDDLSDSDSLMTDELMTENESALSINIGEDSPNSQLSNQNLLKYDFGNDDGGLVSTTTEEKDNIITTRLRKQLILAESDLEPEHELSASRLLINSEQKQSMRSTWISHRSHRQENVPVDHIFYLNPSEQEEKRLPPIPDWTNLVYREIFLRMTENQEIRSIQDIFETFDTANKSFITLEEFKNALVTLGFIGEGKSALTDEEITVLVSCADKDGNGMIDYKEFCDRFWLAANDKEQQQLYSYRFGKKSFFARSNWLSSDLSAAEPSTEGEGESESDDFSMDNISIISSKATKAKSDVIVEAPKKAQMPAKLGLSLGGLSTAFAVGAKISLDTRHMPDLTIKSAKLLPKELEQGIWPSDYTLSDHGMVEVVFKAGSP